MYLLLMFASVITMDKLVSCLQKSGSFAHLGLVCDLNGNISAEPLGDFGIDRGEDDRNIG